MYKLFTLATLILALGGAAGASDNVTTDRSWWEALDEGTQATVMMATISGYQSGYVDGYSRRAAPKFHKTMGAYMDGVKYFYSSHPDKGGVDFTYVLPCLADKPVKSCDKIAADGF